jgi:hypothetical protein
MLEYYVDIIREDKRTFWSSIRARNKKTLWASVDVVTSKQNAVSTVMDLVKSIGRNKCRVTFHDKLTNKTKEM